MTNLGVTRLWSARARGFTLIELLIVMTISGVLVAVASPSFMAAVRANRLDVAGASFGSAVMLARSEAIKRASLTIVEPVSGTDWTSGVRVYVDGDLNASNSYVAATDILIRQFDGTRNLTITGAPNRLAFDSRGQNVVLGATSDARTPTTASLPLCIAPLKRTLQINQAGYVSKADASC